MQLKIEIFDRLFDYSVFACDEPRDFTIGFLHIDGDPSEFIVSAIDILNTFPIHIGDERVFDGTKYRIEYSDNTQHKTWTGINELPESFHKLTDLIDSYSGDNSSILTDTFDEEDNTNE